MDTPLRRQTRGQGAAASAPLPEEATPRVAASSRNSKSTNRPTKPKDPETLARISEEEREENEGSFDGHATMRRGQLSAAKRKHAEAVVAPETAGFSSEMFESELKRRCDEIAERISQECIDDMNNLRKNHAEEVKKLKKELESVRKASSKSAATVTKQIHLSEMTRLADELNREKNTELDALKINYEMKLEEMRVLQQPPGGDQSPAESWSMNEVIKYLISNKLRNLNDGHSSQATNKTINYIVSKEELALCLHCFARGRSPDSCIFKKGKFGSLLHRKPKSGSAVNAKCSKPGIPDRNDPKVYHCRHILGKDYLLFR